MVALSFASQAISSNVASEIIIRVPAVYDSSGEVFEITVRENVNETLIVQGPGTIDNDTLASIWSSIFIANILSSSPYWKSGFTIVFPSQIKSIGGPSASLGLSIAILKLINNDNVNTLYNYSITGAVNINGLTTAVGGVEAKLNATIRMGLKGMVLPISNLVEVESQASNVVPVASIYELYLMSQGYGLNSTFIKRPATEYPGDIRDYLDNVYWYFRNKTNVELDIVKTYIKYADEAYLQGKMYAASSLAFTAYTRYLQTLYSNMNITELHARYESLKEKSSILREKLVELEKQKVSSKLIGLYDVELLSLGESRLWMCMNLLTSFEQSNFTDRNTLAQADARCLTAEFWINAANTSFASQPLIDSERMNNYINMYIFYLDKYVWYVESLITKLNATNELSQYLLTLKSTYQLITENKEAWSLPLKLGLATELAQDIAIFMDAFNTETEYLLDKYIAEEYRTWYLLYSRANLYQLDSIVSNLYLEYSEFMKDKDPLIAYQMASQAVVSLYPIIIYTKTFSSEQPSESLLIEKKTMNTLLNWAALMLIIFISSFLAGLVFGKHAQKEKQLGGNREPTMPAEHIQS